MELIYKLQNTMPSGVTRLKKKLFFIKDTIFWKIIEEVIMRYPFK